jgi:hypothetical protein
MLRIGLMTTRYRLHVVPWLRRPAGLIFRDWLAITIGRDIVAWRGLEPRELAHEVEHVRQWAQHGALFVVRYWLASASALRGGGHWYRDNSFEVAARAAADAVRGIV